MGKLCSGASYGSIKLSKDEVLVEVVMKSRKTTTILRRKVLEYTDSSKMKYDVVDFLKEDWFDTAMQLKSNSEMLFAALRITYNGIGMWHQIPAKFYRVKKEDKGLSLFGAAIAKMSGKSEGLSTDSLECSPVHNDETYSSLGLTKFQLFMSNVIECRDWYTRIAHMVSAGYVDYKYLTAKAKTLESTYAWFEFINVNKIGYKQSNKFSLWIPDDDYDYLVDYCVANNLLYTMSYFAREYPNKISFNKLLTVLSLTVLKDDLAWGSLNVTADDIITCFNDVTFTNYTLLESIMLQVKEEVLLQVNERGYSKHFPKSIQDRFNYINTKK